jgi:hypothetical protein
MARFPQRLCTKGSQRWIQWFVNHAPEVLNEQIALGAIDWRSPLAADEYAEYRDEAFLRVLGIDERCSLDSFWPRGGPQWDALGIAESGELLLVEAKAHVNELYSPATGASASSLPLIRTSLAQTAAAIGVPSGYDWSKQFYQYANRLAHGHFLNANRIAAKMVFLYFTGDADVHGPASHEEWETAIEAVHWALGLNTRPDFVVDAFIDVRPYRLLHPPSDSVLH